jgi:hypothetical protein
MKFYLYRCCGNKKCEPNYGIKRPKHSEIMRAKAKDPSNEKYLTTLMKKGEKFNEEVNSTEFKRKQLKNKGFECSGLSDDEIEKEFSRFLSNRFKSRKSISSRLIKLCDKHELWHIFDKNEIENIDTVSEDRFAELKYSLHSWHHEFYCSEVCVARHFKRILMDGLKYNDRGITCVLTRSSYEANYISFFEKAGIRWDYEPFRINLDNGGKYKPDFVVWYNGKKYIVEVKGFILKDGEKYMQYKLNAAFDYCCKNGFAGIVYTFQANPKNMEEILKFLVKGKYVNN